MSYPEDTALLASPVSAEFKALQPVLLVRQAAVSSFYRQHLWLPLLAFTGLSVLLMGLGADQWLADRLYAWQGHAWALQSSPLVQGVLHEGGRQGSKWAWYAAAMGLLLAMLHRPLAAWRWPLAYLLASTLLATMLVAAMKRITHMDCPWDLLRYGGEKAYYGLFARRPAGLASAGCFPAGHASAGYAWVASYFFFLATAPRWRWWGLGCALAAGLLFGIAQQLRGAHFLSHDVWSLMVCWLVALSLFRLLLLPRMHVMPSGTTA